MKLLYLDLVGGAAGDMILAALLDAGVPLERVQRALEVLELPGVELRVERAFPAGLRALRADVWINGRLADLPPEQELPPQPALAHGHDHDHHTHRPYRVVRAMLESVPLAARVKSLALAAFHVLAVAEGEAHGVPADDVVFHEVGSDDAIADIVGVAAAVAELAPDEIVVSPVPLGRGLTRGAHGPIPLPGPATLSILRGVPVYGTELRGETVTPTGAALLRVMASRFGPAPAMTLDRIGSGAGHREWPDRPNIVRAFVGASAAPGVLESAEERVYEVNLDDMTPAQVAVLERALFEAGAVDVWSQPIGMKKGRSGLLVSALARSSLDVLITSVFLTHSTTLGVRSVPVMRARAERRIVAVDTPYGSVRVKVSPRPAGPALAVPEHDDCERLAREHQLPLRAVSEAALRAFWSRPGEER